MSTVYVLELVGGFWYVGKTGNAEARLRGHRSGVGCEWTRLHPPLRMVLQQRLESPVAAGFDEERRTKELMLRHGVDRVRGGQYAGIELSRAQIREIDRSHHHAGDECFKCGGQGHFANACIQDKDAYNGEKAGYRRNGSRARGGFFVAAASVVAAFTHSYDRRGGSPAAQPDAIWTFVGALGALLALRLAWHCARNLINGPDVATPPEQDPDCSNPRNADAGDTPSALQPREQAAHCGDGRGDTLRSPSLESTDFDTITDCDRCGRDGHVNTGCNEAHHANGAPI